MPVHKCQTSYGVPKGLKLEMVIIIQLSEYIEKHSLVLSGINFMKIA